MGKIYRNEFCSILNDYQNGIEIGVASGNYSKIIATWGFDNLFLVDKWEEFRDQRNKLTTQEQCNKQYNTVCEYFKDAEEVEILKCSSIEASKKFVDDMFDFIYIDACHSYNAVLEDLYAWYPKCKIGGLYSGHDFVLPDVKKAVDEFCSDKGLSYQTTSGTHRIPPSWYLIKEGV